MSPHSNPAENTHPNGYYVLKDNIDMVSARNIYDNRRTQLLTSATSKSIYAEEMSLTLATLF